MSKIKKIIKKVAPIALPIIGAATGNPWLAAAGGGLGGALNGGGLKGALQGGITSGLTAGLSGGAGGGLSKSLFGNAAQTLGKGVFGPPSPASAGALGTFGKIGSASVSQFAKPASTLFSGVKSYLAQDDMEDQLLEAQGKSEGALKPFFQTGIKANQQLSDRLAAGYTPENLENDPGYQFEREQGMKALDRVNASRGGYYSGAALKEGADFSTNLASRKYNEGFERWLNQNNQLGGQAGSGQNAANSLTKVYDNQGLIGAGKTLGQNNIMSSTLSNLMNGGRQIIGHKADGTPVYADEDEEELV
jgi:hypothetical protein